MRRACDSPAARKPRSATTVNTTTRGREDAQRRRDAPKHPTRLVRAASRACAEEPTRAAAADQAQVYADRIIPIRRSGRCRSPSREARFMSVRTKHSGTGKRSARSRACGWGGERRGRVNARTLDQYFGRETSRMSCSSLRGDHTGGQFRTDVNVCGAASRRKPWPSGTASPALLEPIPTSGGAQEERFITRDSR